ncbi:MAG: LemA family protein [Clostridia bacterium]|nr:LemA family protein [Clostridia bacterium]MBQ7375416.1 LemA family protein [Clostridia bacterium]
MANQLDELSGDIREEGLETNVIAKRIPATVGVGSTIFEILLWVCGIIPGVIFLIMKVKAKNYLQQLEQKLQHNASQIDNYLEQRVVVLQNCARLLDKAIDLDKSTFESIARYRSGAGDEARNAVSGQIDDLSRSINIAVENYPDLKAHNEIADAMKQNMYLQREITAARELYNDTVNAWNRAIFSWPTKQIVAARNGYTTRLPFIASKEIKEKANDVFF